MKHKNDVEFNAKLSGKQKFGLRKLSVGLAAVALGTCFYMSNGQLVHADENSAANADQAVATENKAEDQQTVSVETHEINANHQEDKSKPVKSSMMAGQDNASVDIKIDHPQVDANKQLIISFPEAGDDNSGKAFKLDVKPGSSDLSGDDSGHWHLDTTPDQITATWQSKNPAIQSTPISLNLSLPVQGNRKTIKNDDHGQTFQVKIGNQIYNAFTTDLTPYKDQVREGEILKGFFLHDTTVGNEKGYNNISQADIDKYHLTDDQKVTQWGIYFNYGSQKGATILTPLMDAIFNTKFSDDQIMIPSSIKVYEVPANMAVDENGYRHGEDDNYINPADPSDPTQNQTYYNKIVSNPGSQRPAFQEFLREHLTTNNENKPNGFAVDQSHDGYFHIGNDDSYSKHAYFIQIDAVMKDKTTVPGDGTTISTSQTLTGTGKTIEETVNWIGVTTGSGQGQNQTEKAHIRFYDDTDKKFIEDSPTLDATGVDTTAIDFGIALPSAIQDILNQHYKFVDFTSGQQIDGQTHQGQETSKDLNNPNLGNYDTNPKVDQDFVVHFVHETEPTKPIEPTQPTEPTSPTTPAPVLPETPANPDHHDETVKPHANSDKLGHKENNVSTVRPHAQSNEHYVKSSKTTRIAEHHYSARALPQTGAKQNNLGLIGLAMASIAGWFGLASDRKRKN